MAQRVNPISLRLGTNLFWNSEWYSSKKQASLFLEDNLIKQYIKNIFENRGFLVKRSIIKRTIQKTFLFIEIYANPYFKHAIPKDYRNFTKYHRILKLKQIKKFLQKISAVPVFLSVHNLFLMNRIHRNFMRRLRGQFFKYKNYRFTLTILGIFNIVLRTKSATFLTRILSYELEFLEKKKKNKIVWRFVSFVGKLIEYLKFQNKAIHGARLQITGRFKGSSRPRKVRFKYGQVPYNTIRALIDYAYSPAITRNGTFGIKTWLCYKTL